MRRTVAAEGKLTFISTGMSTYDDIDRAVAIFREVNCPSVLMHCVAEYPAPVKHLNMQMVHKLRYWEQHAHAHGS